MLHQIAARVLPRSAKNFVHDVSDRVIALAYSRRPWSPPPHAIKARSVIERGRAHSLQVLIETGTCMGEMARKCSTHFREILTVELSKNLAAEAARRLARRRNIRVLCGESTELLPHILAEVSEPALFWLDAHYSGGVTAKGATECPLEREIEIIAKHFYHDHVIMIDDVRLMGTGDYPTLAKVCELVRSINPEYRIEVLDDILICAPLRQRAKGGSM